MGKFSKNTLSKILTKAPTRCTEPVEVGRQKQHRVTPYDTTMKTAFKLISIVAIIFVVISMDNMNCSGNQDVLNDLKNKHLHINKRIDTMQVKLDQIEWLANEIDVKVDCVGNRQIKMYGSIQSIESDIDTLKVGQLIIYDEVTNFQTNKETLLNWTARQALNWFN